MQSPEPPQEMLAIYSLVGEVFNCYDYFLRLSGFPDLFGKVFSPNLTFQRFFRKSNVNKRV